MVSGFSKCGSNLDAGAVEPLKVTYPPSTGRFVPVTKDERAIQGRPHQLHIDEVLVSAREIMAERLLNGEDLNHSRFGFSQVARPRGDASLLRLRLLKRKFVLDLFSSRADRECSI
jgi:hypothetical protein